MSAILEEGEGAEGGGGGWRSCFFYHGFQGYPMKGGSKKNIHLRHTGVGGSSKKFNGKSRNHLTPLPI